MKKNYLQYFPILLGSLFLILLVSSCKKNAPVAPAVVATGPANFAKLGLYEQLNNNTRRIFIPVSKLGDVASLNYGLVFDTGSTGLTIDATGIIPSSMITPTGFQITGDSVNVNGITITSQKTSVSYGGVDGSITEYGNLAYATVTIGNSNGSVTTPRIPFFLYYTVIDGTTNKALPAHSADVFGVGPGTSFPSKSIGSPLSYFSLASNITSGFRLALLNSSNFGGTATYTPGLLYIGLTPDDLNASNFIMHPLTYTAISGYSPNIASTITYNGQNVPGIILFDTGTPTTSIIEDNGAASNAATTLPANTTVSITTGQGFSYQYIVSTDYNLTEVENPKYSNDHRTVFSIDFFISNEYLLDYTNHRIGLKNN